MSFECVYYPDHAERYKHMSEDERMLYPDELVFPSGRRIKRDRTFREIARNNRDGYGYEEQVFASKDISLHRAQKWFYP